MGLIAPSWGKRLLGIEGLRAFAALAVMIGHVHGKLAPTAVPEPWDRLLGFTGHGLTLFFALSGFLLFRPFAAALINGTPRPDVGKYAINRLLRIYPAYVVILLIVSFVLGVANTQAPTWGDSDFSRTDSSVGFLRNPAEIIASLFMVQTMFPSTNRLGIGVAWSLSVELVFYILLPLLAMLAARSVSVLRGRLGSALVPVTVLLVLGIAGKIVSSALASQFPAEDRFALEWGDNWYAVLNRSIVVHADLFAYGMGAAVIVVLAQAGRLSPNAIRNIRISSVAVAVTFGAAALIGLGRSFNDSLMGLACGAILLIVVLPNSRSQHSRLARALEFAPIRYTGLVSYSFYLWHVPVIWILIRAGWVFPDTPIGLLGNCATTFVISLALSSITYFAVEAPALRLKQRTAPARKDRNPDPNPRVDA